jgi:replication-associated recombination protein RarA
MTAYIQHAPTSLADVILPDSLAIKLNMMASADDIQPMLFYGKPGTGKSLTAKMLTANHQCFRCDGVDSPTETLNMAWKAASTLNLFDLDCRRLIILDEIDRWNEPMQEKIRALIDERGHVASFLATTNYIDEVIPALKSRLTPICFDVEVGNLRMISKWKERMAHLHAEHFGRPIEDSLLKAALSHFPDGRRMMTTLFTGLVT